MHYILNQLTVTPLPPTVKQNLHKKVVRKKERCFSKEVLFFVHKNYPENDGCPLRDSINF